MATTNELRALLAAATKGPWKVTCPRSRYNVKSESGDYVLEEGHGCNRQENAALIAAAVNSLPGLLDERDALIRKLRAHCNSGTSATVHAFAKELLRDMGEE